MWRRVLCAVVVTLATPLKLPADEPVAFCPAVRHDDEAGFESRRNGNTEEPPSAVAIIAVGRIQRNEDVNGHSFVLLVDRVLFGPRLKRIPLGRFAAIEFMGLDEDEKQIYCLSIWPPDRRHAEAYFAVSDLLKWDRVFPVTEERALAAVGQARLDLLVLESGTIFVGRPLATRTIERPSTLKVKKKVVATTVLVESIVHGNRSLVAQKIETRGLCDPFPVCDSYLYFANDWMEARESFYKVSRRWPVSELSQVEATLKRASLFPIKSEERFDKTWQSREIFFTGSREEASALLRSECHAARELATRRLAMLRDGGHPVFLAPGSP